VPEGTYYYIYIVNDEFSWKGFVELMR
jgi:hypothetical protein